MKECLKKAAPFLTVLLLGVAVLFGAYTAKAATSVAMEINGFQISATSEGIRTVYSFYDPNNEISERGLIYGIDGYSSSSDLIIGTSNSYVHSYAATASGKFDSAVSGTASYAMTMKLIDKSSFYSTNIMVRAYVKLSDGSYMYTDVYTFNVYDVAMKLYTNSSMSTQAGHEYLYNKIISVVNPSADQVAYNPVEEETTTEEVTTSKTISYTTAGANWNDFSCWSLYVASGWGGDPTVSYYDGGSYNDFAVRVDSAADSEWAIQTKTQQFSVTIGANYRATATVVSNAASNGTIIFKDDQSNTSNYYSVVSGTNTFTVDFTAANSGIAQIFFELHNLPAGTEFHITSFTLVNLDEVSQETTTVKEETTASQVTTSKSTEVTTQASEEETSSDETVTEQATVYVGLSQSAITLTDEAGNAVSDSGVSFNSGAVTITHPGTYVLSGTLTDGSITCKSGDGEYYLILNGVNITSSTTACIYGTKKADELHITLNDGTENFLTGPSTYVFAEGEDEPDAVIFAKKELKLKGAGSLKVIANTGDGIKCKDELSIKKTLGNLTVIAADEGIVGKDSLEIKGGTINITADGDGMTTNNQTDTSLGWFDMSGGSVTINSKGDGIVADTNATISGGTLDITTTYISTHDSFKGIKCGGTITTTAEDGTTSTSLEGLLTVSGGTLTFNTVEDALNSKKDLMISDGNVTANTWADGIQAEYNLTISNEAYVNVTTNKNSSYSFIDSYKAIKAGNDSSGLITISGGTVIAKTTNVGTNGNGDDTIHSDYNLAITGGNITLTSGDDGIHAENDLTISDGTVTITQSYEGLEAYIINLNGGNVNVVASDDGVNAAGGNDSSGSTFYGPGGSSSSTFGYLYINGGTYTVNAEGDGLDSNGNISMTGGTVYVWGPTSGGNGILDYGDSNASFTKSGGILIGAGTSDMAVYPTCSSGALCSFSVSGSANQACSITVGSNTYSFTPAKSYQLVIISTPDMVSGTSYTLKYNGSSTASATASTTGSSGGSGSGGGGFRPW